jgi:hypothetical protein
MAEHLHLRGTLFLFNVYLFLPLVIKPKEPYHCKGGAENLLGHIFGDTVSLKKKPLAFFTNFTRSCPQNVIGTPS